MDIAKGMNSLLRKDKSVQFQWTDEAQKAFDSLKKRFTEKPVLAMPDQTKEFQIETDASKYASGGVLSQIGTDGLRHPCAFISQSFSAAEQSYGIEERELLAILRALDQWGHYVIGAKIPTKILTDHHNILTWNKPRNFTG